MVQYDKKIRNHYIACATIVLGLTLLIGSGINLIQDIKNETKEQTPGSSVTTEQRHAVNAMNDSTLRARTAYWVTSRADFDTQMARAEEQQTENRKNMMQQNRTLNPVILPAGINTLAEYKKFLDNYKRDSIEARYQQLAKQITK